MTEQLVSSEHSDPRSRGVRRAHRIASGLLLHNVFSRRGDAKPNNIAEGLRKLDAESATSFALEAVAGRNPEMGRFIFDSLAAHKDPRFREAAADMAAVLFPDEETARRDPMVQALLVDSDPEVVKMMDASAFIAGPYENPTQP